MDQKVIDVSSLSLSFLSFSDYLFTYLPTYLPTLPYPTLAYPTLA